MAQFFEDWSGSTVGQEPTGWTKKFATSGTTWTIENDTSGHATAGKRLYVAKSATDRAALIFDAVGSLALAERVQVRVLISSRASVFAQFGGPCVMASGAAGSESAVYGSLTGSNKISNVQLNNGASSVLGMSVGSAYGKDAYYWLTTTAVDGAVTTSIASVSTPETAIATITHTSNVTTGGEVGLFASWETARLHILAVGVGTGGDDAPYAPLPGGGGGAVTVGSAAYPIKNSAGSVLNESGLRAVVIDATEFEQVVSVASASCVNGVLTITHADLTVGATYHVAVKTASGWIGISDAVSAA